MLPWHLLPIEVIQLIFNHLPSLDLFKNSIITQLYSSDILIHQSFNHLLSKRYDLFKVAHKLKNVKLLIQSKPTIHQLNRICKDDIKYGNLKWIESLIFLGVNDWDRLIKYAASENNLPLVEYFIQKGANNRNCYNYGMFGAAKGGHLSLVKYFIEKGASKFHWCLKYAAKGGNIEIIELLIKMGNITGINNWNYGMSYAANGGHLPIVEYFIQKGANDWEDGMRYAAWGAHVELVEFFIQKGANNWNDCLDYAASVNNIELVNYFIDKGANNWINGIVGFSSYGNMDMIKYFVNRAETDKINISAFDWNRGMISATIGGHLEVVEYFVHKGANIFKEALYWANIYGDVRLIEYFNGLLNY